MSKACLITGASRGIGRATAIAASDCTDISHIILIARDKTELENTKRSCCSGKKITCIPFDLSHIEVLPTFVESALQELGPIDFLVNVAGFADPLPLFETDYANLQNTFNVNVFSLILLTREIAKSMRSNQISGKIVNIASTAGIGARPGWLSYAASKAAVISISDTLSSELSEYGISVFCLSPGRCATQLREKLAPMEDPATIMQPERVAEVIVDLLKNGSCLDGQNIIVRQSMKV